MKTPKKRKKSRKPKSEASEVEDLIGGTEVAAPPETVEPSKAAEAAQRAERCYEEIVKVLKHHQCDIEPFILPPQKVGESGRQVMIGASWGVIPILV